MSFYLSYPRIKCFDPTSGDFLAGGYIYTYVAGTNTPITTYSDATMQTENTNPVCLDALGEAMIYLSAATKIVIKDIDGVTIKTIDNLTTPISAIGPITIAEDTTVTDDLHLFSGDIYTVADGVTLTINGSFEAGLYQVFSCAGTGRVVFGPGAVNEVRPEWWGAVRDGTTDDSLPVSAALNAGVANVRFQEGTYVCNVTASSRVNLHGSMSALTLLQSSTNTGYALTLDYTYPNTADWAYMEINRIGFIGKTGTTRTSGGVTFGNTGTNYEYKGRYHFNKCYFNNLNMAIYKRYGNFGNRFSDCDFEVCNYHYYVEADGVTSQGGTDLFDNNQWRGAQIVSQFINDGSAQHTYIHNIWETNPGFVFFVYQYRPTGAGALGTTGGPGILLSNCYVEENATAGPVNVLISGTPTAETTVEYYLRNCPNFVLDNTPLARATLVNSIIFGRNCDNRRLEGLGEAITKDSASAVWIDGVNVDSTTGLSYYASSIHRMLQKYGTTATSMVVTKPRTKITQDTTHARYTASFTNGNVFPFVDSVAPNPTTNGTLVNDGQIFDSCGQIVVPDGKTFWLYPAPGINVSVPDDEYIVWSVDLKQVSGGAVKAVIPSVTDPAGFSITSFWQTYAGLTVNDSGGALTAGGLWLINSSGSSGTVNCSALQVMSFDKLEEALKYLDSGLYCAASVAPKVFYSTTAPTTGTWAVGDICINRTPAVGQPKGWRCTAAGTPGTWVSEGNL